MPTKLERGIEAAKAGDLDTARQLLAESVAEDANNERVWLWLTEVTDDDRQRRVYLMQALRINPNSEPARRGLAALDAQQAQATQAREEPGRQPLAPDTAPSAAPFETEGEPAKTPEAEPVTAAIEDSTQPVLGQQEEPLPAAGEEEATAELVPPGQAEVTDEPALTTDEETLTVVAEDLQPTEPEPLPIDEWEPTEPLLPTEPEPPPAEDLSATEVTPPPEEEALLAEPVWPLEEQPFAEEQEATMPPTEPEPWSILPVEESSRAVDEAQEGAAPPEEPKASTPPDWADAVPRPDASPGVEYIHTDRPLVEDARRPEPGLWVPVTSPGAEPDADQPPDDEFETWDWEASAGAPVSTVAEEPAVAEESAEGKAGFLSGVSPLLYVAAGIVVCTIVIAVLWLAFPSLRESLRVGSTAPPAETAAVVSVPTRDTQLRPMLESKVTVVSALTPTTCDPCDGNGQEGAVVATVEYPTAGPSLPNAPPTPLAEPPIVELPSPTVSDPVGWIVAYVTRSPASGTVHSLTHLQRRAHARRVEFQVFQHEAGFQQALKRPEVTAALYGGLGSTESLQSLANLVERGGRVVLLYNPTWQEQNELLDALFGVTVEREQVATSQDTFVYPPTIQLSDWLSGLSLALRQEGSTFALSAYLVANAPGGARGEIASEASGESRLLVYASPDEAVTFWPAVTASASNGPEILDHFFSDRNIERFANLGGAGRLLDRLLGQ